MGLPDHVTPLGTHLRLPCLFGRVVPEPFLVDPLPVGITEGPSCRAIACPDGAFTVRRNLACLRVDTKYGAAGRIDLVALLNGIAGRLGVGRHVQDAKYGNYNPREFGLHGKEDVPNSATVDDRFLTVAARMRF
jgi:hypothetical protein